MPRPEFWLAFGLGLAAFFFVPSGASAYCRMSTEGGLPAGSAGCDERGALLEWDRSCLSYAVDADGSRWMSFEQTEAAVDAGFFAWAQVECDGAPTDVTFLPLEAASCKKSEYNSDGGNVNTVAFLDPWTDPSTGSALARTALAITVVWHNERTGQILDADMLVNDTRRLCPPEAPSCGGFDLQSIVTHETGHFLGLGHSPVETSTMHYVSPSQGDTSIRTLDKDDISGLCAIYPSGTEAPVCQPTDFDPLGGLALDCENEVEPEVCDPAEEPCEEPVEPTPDPDPDCDEAFEDCEEVPVDPAPCDEGGERCPGVSTEVDDAGGSGCSLMHRQRAKEHWLWAFLGLALLSGRRRRMAGRV